ncbi:MAG: hypothetical protein P4L99_23720 [Chthoniobacter sp.]|nr:hypothetical protein [Chthoniobacter sp.]
MTPEESAGLPKIEFERFDTLLKRVIAVPKSEIDKREAEYKEQRKAAKENARKKTGRP